MSVTDNIAARLQRIAEDTTPREAQNDVNFNLTDSSNNAGGTVNPITIGGELAWALATDSKLTVAFPAISQDTGSLGGGITLVFRARFNTFEGTDRPGVFGATANDTNNVAGVFIGAENDNTLRARHSTEGTINFPLPTLGTVSTIVVKVFATDVNNGDLIKVWVQGGDRTTNEPDYVQGSGDNIDPRTGMDNLYFLCIPGTQMDILDAVAYGDEKTDAECVSLADNLRTVLPDITGPSNQLPVANAGADQLGIAGGSTIQLNGTGSTDGDGTISSYTWSQTSGATANIVSPNQAITDVVLPAATGSEQTLVFRLDVVDDQAGADPDGDNVTVTIAQASTDGTVTLTLRNNAGTLLVDQTNIVADIYNIVSGSLVVRKTAQTTNTSATMLIVDPLIVSGTEYRVVLSQGTSDGIERATAT